MIRENAIESFKRSNEQAKLRLEVEKMRMDSCEIKELEFYIERDEMAIRALEQEPQCKNCKWWKDSDGVYRRGIGVESQCPINRREVFEGNGYCYMFEPQESEKV